MNRKEFQEFLDNFPEDTEILVTMAEEGKGFYNQIHISEKEFTVNDEDINALTYRDLFAKEYICIIGNMFEFHNSIVNKTLLLGRFLVERIGFK